MSKPAREGKTTPNLGKSGVYTVPEAALLIGVSPRKIRAWIQGWPGSMTSPVIPNDLGWLGNHLAFSFANLMELRFIAFFVKANVKMREIRAIMSEARELMQHPHPFATNSVFRTDGSKIVAEIAQRNGVKSIYDLRSKNFEMGGVIYQSLKDGIVYDPHGNAHAWFPRRLTAPNVILHPAVAFGRPSLKRERIPTEAIDAAVRAEGGDIDMVADLFEISKKRVEEAVRFESDLRRAA